MEYQWLLFVYVQEEERMSHKRVERAHLTITPPSKKCSNHSEMLSFKRETIR